MKTLFGESEGTYQRVSDYYLPDLELPQQIEKANYGRYGRMRKKFLKNNYKGIYSSMLLNGTLNRVLNETDFSAVNAIERLIKEMAAAQGITEVLKATDQMSWIGAMNNIREAAEEIILNEFIYRYIFTVEMIKQKSKSKRRRSKSPPFFCAQNKLWL